MSNYQFFNLDLKLRYKQLENKIKNNGLYKKIWDYVTRSVSKSIQQKRSGPYHD
jgi:hypothetical protein